MIINHNMGAMNANRQMGINAGAASKSMEKLSSGLRINKAGDDAAGLAISEKMRGQIRGLDQASSNAQDAISLIGTAEGGLSETHSILQRMRELSVQSANDTNIGTDRAEIQKEVVQLKSEIDRISTDTEFNTQKLLSGNLGGKVIQNATNSTVLAVAGVAAASTSGAPAGTYTITANAGKLTMAMGGVTQEIDNAGGAQTLNFSKFGITVETNAAYVQDKGIGDVEVGAGAVKFQVGANSGQSVSLSISDMSTRATGLNLTGVDLTTQAGANTALETIDTAIKSVSSERAKLGAFQNRLEHTIANLGTSSENLTSAESRIRDVNMAKEMSTFSKNNILSQAAQAMLSQANQQPQQVLQLLR